MAGTMPVARMTVLRVAVLPLLTIFVSLKTVVRATGPYDFPRRREPNFCEISP